MPLGKTLRSIQIVKDDLIFNLIEEQKYTYEEVAWIFNMSRQGVHKSVDRTKKRIGINSVQTVDKES